MKTKIITYLISLLETPTVQEQTTKRKYQRKGISVYVMGEYQYSLSRP